MEYADLLQKLSAVIEKYDSQTFLGSFRDTVRSSLLKEGLSTRANSLWKMAQFVVAKKDAGSPDGASSGYLAGWKTLASNYNNQTLFLEVEDLKWEMYDAQGVKLGDEEYIKDFLEKMSLKQQGEQPVVALADFSKICQRIFYGAPGTGKSHGVDETARNLPKEDVVRTTFHPDSDYSMFVGAYKPTMVARNRYEVNQTKAVLMKYPEDDGLAKARKDEPIVEKVIYYSFVPQAFAKAYVRAWKRMAEAGEVKPVMLVIEEINRGNCAQIFGDLFQLLDRDEDGYSTYPIIPDSDFGDWLASQFVQLNISDADVRSGRILKLPPNLYIWATMNTSDQSLFPIDSAFKRRWDWKYVPIAKPDKSDDPDWKERKIKVGSSLYDWWDFLSIINKHITKATESEDKQLGYFFVKAPDNTGYITADQFANKVLFYLYGDVFKSYDLPAAAFKRDGGAAWTFRDFFYSETVVVLKADGQIVKDADGNVAKTVTDETTQMLKRPGDVNEFEMAAFLDHLKWKDASGENLVRKTSIGADA